MINLKDIKEFNKISTISYIVLTLINGIGKHVKKTDNNKNTFLPQISDIAPIKGALKNDNIPLMLNKILK